MNSSEPAGLTEFGATLLGLLEKRGMEVADPTIALADAAYYGVTEEALRGYVEGREAVDSALPAFVDEALDLSPEERQELARAFAFGQGLWSDPRRSPRALWNEGCA